MVAVDGEPSAPPTGLLRLTVNVSAPSEYESSIKRTLKVFDVSPGAKLSPPEELM
jgi:hypothetical protein